MYKLTINFDSVSQLKCVADFIASQRATEVAPTATSIEVAPTVASIEVAPTVASTPWDARIHSSTRSVTNSGEWVKRRNVDKAEYERVLAEINAPAEYEQALAEVDDFPATLTPVEPVQAEIRYENMQEALAHLANVVSKVIGDGAVLPQDIMGEYKLCGVNNLDQLNSDLELVNKVIVHFESKSA